MGGNPRGIWAWAFYDWANAGFNTLVQTFVFAAYFTAAVAADSAAGTAMWGNAMSLAGLCVGLSGPLVGAIADHTGRRKPWIAALTVLCIAATALLWFVKPDPAYAMLAVGLAFVGVTASESAQIFYNAMLPDLVPEDRLGRWSGWGWAMGYAGGLICLVLALYGFIDDGAFIRLPRTDAVHVRTAMLFSALWYAVFALPMFLRTPDTPSTGRPLGEAVREGLVQVRQSIAHARQYKDIGLFLLARMLYNDGLTTLFAFGGIYAAGTFGMDTSEVILFGIGLNVTAGLGAAGFAWIDDRSGPRRTLILSLLGLIAAAIATLAVSDKTLFWIFGLAVGIFVGPVQASSRSYLAHAAPAELRNQFFGLFALSGKVTAFLGPLLVGRITLAAQSQRAGMASVVALFVLGLALLLAVPPVKRHQTPEEIP